MKQKHYILLLLGAVMLLTMPSCSKDQFDKDAYNQIVDSLLFIDNADPDHDWCLTKNDTITVTTPGSSIYSVQILTSNPYTTTNAEIAAAAITYVWDGNKASLAYTIPITQSQVWLAGLDSKGNCLGVTSFNYGTKEIELTTDMLDNSGSFEAPTYQTFTYIYESTFPMPDDFDYNDMVLRITKFTPDIANSLAVDLTVKLEACGAGELYGAAIQLAGINYDDLNKVEIVEGERFDKEYPLQRLFITNSNTLLRGRHGEAVINLFECAQWAMSKTKDKLGDIDAIKYNTSHQDVENVSATVTPPVVTYRLTFKDRDKARSLTYDRIDPFIIHQNTDGGIWEVHTYAHKFDETLWACFNGYESAYDNHVSWAIVIPKADFRYPIEGMSLCSFNSTLGETFGPYEGFAGWIQDHLTNLNWYVTPTREQLVY